MYKTKKDCYDYGEDITPEQLTKTVSNKYEVLLTSSKWNFFVYWTITYHGTDHSSGKNERWKPQVLQVRQ